jgi:malate dehydrogenase (oxaloacetate-decarboxylating)
MSDYFERSLILHEQIGGKIATHSKVPLRTQDDLSLAYTPGVAGVCNEIARDVRRVFDLTIRGTSVAIVSDGSAVLGLGNIGAEAALPVMEGKAALFQEYAGITGFPICLATQDPDEIVQAVRWLAPTFGGINLEDISAPRCFTIEQQLQDLGIPVMHDDQHGTAVVVLAAVINAAALSGRNLEDLTVVINGAGAAGSAIARLLRCVGQDPDLCVPVRDVLICDSRGILGPHRDDLAPYKQELLTYSNAHKKAGNLSDALQGADVFIGVSKGNLLNADHIRSMADDPLVFGLANPIPEIMPEEALAAGAAIVGTGRSDFPNQINNVLAFPGIFRGALEARSSVIDDHMKIVAAHALAKMVPDPRPDRVLPSPLDKAVAYRVAQAVAEAAPRR